MRRSVYPILFSSLIITACDGLDPEARRMAMHLPPVGFKSDAEQGMVYLQELRAAVLKGLKAGQSVDELKASVTMDRYRSWGSYDSWRALNVEGMARHLGESGAVN